VYEQCICSISGSLSHVSKYNDQFYWLHIPEFSAVLQMIRIGLVTLHTFPQLLVSLGFWFLHCWSRGFILKVIMSYWYNMLVKKLKCYTYVNGMYVYGIWVFVSYYFIWNGTFLQRGDRIKLVSEIMLLLANQKDCQ
jgi:hypothetical protein